jgi:hypothetical protein
MQYILVHKNELCGMQGRHVVPVGQDSGLEHNGKVKQIFPLVRTSINVSKALLPIHWVLRRIKMVTA